MTRSRTLLFMIIGLFILLMGIVLSVFHAGNRNGGKLYPATINRDCAPWDGAAFTISIVYDSGTGIDISIWKSPDIKLPTAFSFPDTTGSIGNAFYRPLFGNPEQLSGQVFLRRVDESGPVEGGFELATQNGKHYSGTFKAQWGHQIMMCG